MKHLLSKPVLPANPDGKQRYVKSAYTPVMPHPYVAFLDAGTESLDAVQGLAKTQEMVLSVWGGQGERATFETKWWARSLQPVRGHLDAEYVAATGALGALRPLDRERFPLLEDLYQGCFDWLDRSIDTLKCYGKFDYGDWKYFTAATDYYCGPGSKWDRWERCLVKVTGRTTSAINCWACFFITTGPADRPHGNAPARLRATFTTWTSSTIPTGACGRTVTDTATWRRRLRASRTTPGSGAADMVRGERRFACRQVDSRVRQSLLGLKLDFEKTDARTGSVYLHMMCQFFEHTGEQAYLDRAAAP